MAGYSGTPLPRKLGLKAGQHALLVRVPADVSGLLEFDEFASVRKTIRHVSKRRFDYVHLFETSRNQLTRDIQRVREILKPDGMVWISWPKKISSVETDITEGVLRQVILPLGLVDIKVCAVNEVWSGLKFMFRKELRAGLSE